MIDTSMWKEFRVGDYFHGIRGTSRKMQKLNDGEVPIIAAARYNQGIAGFYDVSPEYENAITVSCNGVGCGSTYYHDYPFAITGDAIVLENIGNVPQGALHFIASVYDVFFTSKYSYTDKCSAGKVESEIIKLPATADGQPDWAYMESYMKQIMEETKKSLENLKRDDDTKHLINVSGWKAFLISDLFEVLKGSRLTKEDKREGSINFVSTSIFNNGVINKIGNTEHIHPANTMVVVYDGHATGRAYYQEEPYWASDSVNVLYPKFQLNKYIGLYLVPIFEKAGEKFVYTDKWNQEKMINTYIHLPITSTGEPDWQYMENYMKNIFSTMQNNLSVFYAT